MTIVTNYVPQTAALNLLNLAAPDSNSSLYVYLGRQIPWPNELIPPVEIASISAFVHVWDNMIGMKNITLNNIELVIPRYNWTTNTIYTAYTDTNPYLFSANIANNPFYIFTSNNEVYKCLSNNNNAPSTTQPSGLGTLANNYTQTTSDGYVWKYMLNVEPGGNFLNNWWVPVPVIAANGSLQQIVESAAIPGSIDIVNVLDGGTNYFNNPQAYIVTITGNGTGANAYAIVTGNQVQQIVMVDRGQNYNYANVIISDGFGSGAIAQAVIPPPGGNGSNAAVELGATDVMIAVTTSNTEGGYFTISNSFRVNGLIVNPLQFSTSTISTNTDVAPYMSITVTPGIGIFVPDEFIYQGTSINTTTFSGVVIDFDPVLNILRINNLRGTPTISGILYGATSGAQRYILSVKNPDVQLYSGQIYAINNSTSIQRQLNQTELFQYVITF